MGSFLQKFLRALAPDEPPAQHVTVGCCSTIRIDEHEENAPHIKDDESTNDASDMG